MAWTAPKTWATAEVVTASMQNTHVRDNFNYLKGLAGAVLIEDALQVNKSTADSQMYVSDVGPRIALGNHATYASRTVAARLALVTSAGTFFGGSGVGDTWLFTEGANGGTAGRLVLGANLSSTQMVLATDGNVGMGTGSPQGRLHGYDAISGFMHWEYDGVDGTARTVISNAVGDVLYRMIVFYIVRADDGTTSAGTMATTVLVPGGGDQALHVTGADTLAIRVNANGSVDVRRSAGTTRTFKVALWGLWI